MLAELEARPRDRDQAMPEPETVVEITDAVLPAPAALLKLMDGIDARA